MNLAPEELVLNVPDVKSLVWDGDDLIDWVMGGQRISLSGAIQPPGIYHSYRFDSAIASPSGRFTALFEKLGTKALLLDHGKLSRELNRSYYCADVYEYPISFLSLPDGTEAIAHCPRDYCRIDIEIAETGRCLTDAANRKPADIFHSRLSVSPGGTSLLSAGWIWHPLGVACLWPLEAVLADSRVLDESAISLSFDNEVESAVFLGQDRLAVATGNNYPDGPPSSESLCILNAADGSLLARHHLAFTAGTLVPFSSDLVLSLHQHPRLLSTLDGRVVYEWPHLKTGQQTSSIIQHLDAIPIFAKHPQLPMFAVVDEEKITVVTVK